jgi:CDP-6-deoxy-D-xylo-4-hexulose-3-dehydrase
MTFYPLATETWDEAELEAIQRVVESRNFTMGREVKIFEEEFASYFGSKFALMVNSGSSANLLAVAGLTLCRDRLIQPGEAVLVLAISWSTTFSPLQQYGLELRFVDIDPETLNLDTDLLDAAVTENTKAIFAVNLLGNPCELGRLVDFCENRGLVLIEDNCESMGARFDGKFTGTFGACGTFSTFFSHHISTMEGGVVVTDDEALYHTMLSLRSHGWSREQPDHSHLAGGDDPFTSKFRFVLPGYNVRPLEMSGAIGREQLKKLPNLIQKRRENADALKSHFDDCPDVRIQSESGESSWFGFSLVLQGRLRDRRAEFIAALSNGEIESRPIVSGNFLNNPVIEHFNYSLGSEITVAEDIDRNGLFIGNHHYPITPQLERCREIVDQVASKTQ